MNQQPDILEQIDLYLEGKLGAEEAKEFELRKNADKEFSDLVLRQKLSNEIIVGNRLNSLKVMMDHDFDSGKVSNKKGNFKWWITGLVIIAALFLIGINYINQKEKPMLIKDNSAGKETINPADVLSDKKQPFYPESKTTDSRIRKKKGVNPGMDAPFNELSPEVLKSEIFEKEAIPISDLKQELNNSDLDSKKTEADKISNHAAVPEKKPIVEVKDEVSENEASGKKNNSYSFKPEFGEVFQIPVEAGKEAEIKIMNRGGSLLFTQKLYGDHVNTWDGRNSHGGISPPGLYIYILEYTNGLKESGQIIIY
jgi:hypothetical protein